MNISRLMAGFAILLVGLGTLVSAQPVTYDSWLKDIGPISEWKMAVLSPLNHTQKRDAYTKTLIALEEHLTQQGFDLVTTEELRPLLRRYRIRSTGQVSIEDAEIIREFGGITTILIPSIDFYYASDLNPEFGLSLRVINPNEMRVVGAVSCSSIGRDHIRLFGVGRITDMDTLITWVVNKAVTQLVEQIEQLSQQKIAFSKTKRIAVIQFNNLSDLTMGGSVAANWTISRLLNRGLVVIEPGAVSEIASLLGDLPVGGIDGLKLKTIAWRYDLDYIITGQIDELRLSRGNSKEATPILQFGGRLLEAETGRIASTYHCEAAGDDGHIVFGLGKLNSAGALLAKKIDNMLDEFKGSELRLTGTFDTK